ncbi:MAG: metallophosphoesterase [Myxococcota bacterium]|jgi:hypothetical protein|nr:metallophosphoesterase [Myxococcota bacterium]
MNDTLLGVLVPWLLERRLLSPSTPWSARVQDFLERPEGLVLHLELLAALRAAGPDSLAGLGELLAARGVAPRTLDLPGRDDVLRLGVVSDLHLASWSEAEVDARLAQVRVDPPDVLVVAGDLASHPGWFAAALDRLAGPWTTLVLAGNHDLWSARLDDRDVVRKPSSRFPRDLPPPPPVPGWTGALPPSSQELWDDVLPDLTRRAGAIWLENEPVMIPEYRLALAGSIGWYDYSADRTGRSVAELAATKGQRAMDAVRVDWPWSDVLFAGERLLQLGLILQWLASRPEVDGTAVFTHVPAFLEQRSPALEADERLRSGDAYFYFPTLGELLRLAPKVVSLVSGHTHRAHALDIPRPGRLPLPVAVVDDETDPGMLVRRWSHRGRWL